MTPDTRMLDIARQHFDLMRGRSLEVPEWQVDGTPVTVHFDPMTLHQRHQLQSRARGNEARGVALAVIMFAKDATGARMFDDDAETLAALETQVDPAVLSRIASEMMRSTPRADLGN